MLLLLPCRPQGCAAVPGAVSCPAFSKHADGDPFLISITVFARCDSANSSGLSGSVLRVQESCKKSLSIAKSTLDTFSATRMVYARSTVNAELLTASECSFFS